MDLMNTYMMMNYLSGIGSASSANPLSPLYSGNRASGAESALSFLEVLQNLQNAQSGTTTGSTASATASSASTAYAAPSAEASDSAKNSSKSKLSAGAEMDAMFERAAEKYNVNVDLLKAIGKAESNFNAKAVSPAGAIGVMQLMPGTARSLGVSDPYDAQQNIMGGAKYISQMLDRYDGDVSLALAAYNAGPGNVDKYDGIPPFTETQNYVKRVTGYMGDNVSVEYAGTGTAVDSTDNTAVSAEAVSSENTGSGNITVSTDTLMTLYNLMRAQMELQLANSLFAWNNDSIDSNSSNLFSL